MVKICPDSSMRKKFKETEIQPDKKLWGNLKG